MRTQFKSALAGMVLLVCVTFISYGQQYPANNKRGSISLEIDPATFVFSGYGVHIRWQPGGSEHLLFGIGTYAMDMPDMLVDMNAHNKNKGWEVRLNRGYGLFGEYHLSGVNRKWFLGGQMGLQTYHIEKKFIEGDEHFSNLLLMGYAGYTWRIFGSAFYLKPWGGIGYSTNISGEHQLGGNEYNIAPLTMFATLHVGYTF